MNNYYDAENSCRMEFEKMGRCFHLWTPENFEIIFTCEADFKMGMNIIGICAKLFPDIIILTFELMSNHLHLTVAGKQSGYRRVPYPGVQYDGQRIKDTFECEDSACENRIRTMFGLIRETLSRYTKSAGRTIDWTHFEPGLRELMTLEDLRNVIVYNNRNGYIVHSEFNPFTYPWGGGRYMFNPDAKRLALREMKEMGLRARRQVSHSRIADNITGLMTFDDYALPTSFCDFETAEKLFRGPSHYFHLLGKNIEANVKIAKEIGESICYTDDELFAVACRLSRDKFNTSAPSQIPVSAKQSLARTLRYEYNASAKQLIRMLKIPQESLSAIGIV